MWKVYFEQKRNRMPNERKKVNQKYEEKIA